MQSLKIEMDIPDAIAGYLQMDNMQIKARLEKLLLADLARQGVISFGKAAELAGVDKMAFITETGHMGIPYLDGHISEVLQDAETIGTAPKRLAQ